MTGLGAEVTCPVFGRAQPELTPSKRQKTGPSELDALHSALTYLWSFLVGIFSLFQLIVFNTVDLQMIPLIFQQDNWSSKNTADLSIIKLIFRYNNSFHPLWEALLKLRRYPPPLLVNIKSHYRTPSSADNRNSFRGLYQCELFKAANPSSFCHLVEGKCWRLMFIMLYWYFLPQ